MGIRRDVLEEAADLIEGDRNAQYGDPNQDFQRTATMWNAYLSGVVERKRSDNGSITISDFIEPHDVAWMMSLLKASRATTSPGKRDHYVDAAGYLGCGADCAGVGDP